MIDAAHSATQIEVDMYATCSPTVATPPSRRRYYLGGGRWTRWFTDCAEPVRTETVAQQMYRERVERTR